MNFVYLSDKGLCCPEICPQHRACEVEGVLNLPNDSLPARLKVC